MVSIVETKAVALRRGTHAENMAFTGVQGEVTVDLGYIDKNNNLGTDVNTTLRLHNGVTNGGIPMARADMVNVSTQILAENRDIISDKNLAYADLSNIETVDDINTKTKIVSTLKSYGIATEIELNDKVNLDTSNLNTLKLTDPEIHNGEIEGNLPLAYANTSNINTANLVNIALHPIDSEDGNKPLSYADLSNVDTTNITISESERTIQQLSITGPVIAKADFSNTNTTYLADTGNRPEEMSGPVLATANLSNVDPNDIVSKLENTGSIYARNDLTNVSDWDMLYESSSNITYNQNINVIDPGDGFETGINYPTNVYLLDDEKDDLLVEVNSVDSSGTIANMTIYKNVGDVDLTNENPFIITSETNVDAVFTITSTDNQDGTYIYSINNIIDGGSGFHEEDSNTFTGMYTVKIQSTGEICNVVCQELYITPTLVESGAIIEAKSYPQYTLTNVNTIATIQSELGVSYEATIQIQSDVYGVGAGVAKIDFTNLGGMTTEDKINEENSPWRIRHNEDFPSLFNNSILTQQDYTITTNGSLWRVLKQFANTPNVTLKTKFLPNTDHSTTPSVTVVDNSSSDDLTIKEYATSIPGKYSNYMIFPNHDYQIIISDNGESDTHIIDIYQPGVLFEFDYSLAIVTFNLNVQQATLTFTTEDEGVYRTINVTNGTYTGLFTRNVTWNAESQGYTEQTGDIDVSNGDQIISITF